MSCRLRFTLLLPLLLFALTLRAQTIRVSCPLFLVSANQRIACVEALLTQEHYHFTLASLPTSNGFGPGMVLTQSFTGTTNGQELDLSVTGAATTNSSWFAGGDATWSLPYLSFDDCTDKSNAGTKPCTDEHNLSSAATLNWHTTALHFNGSHRTIRTLYFYGFGSRSPAIQYTYAEDDTWGEFDARIPIAHDVVLTGESQLEGSALPPPKASNSVFLNFPPDQIPGITRQPFYINNSIGLDSRVVRQPTLGGNDIAGNVTLSGWDDYRFRDRDAALLQFEADYILWDPFGIYAFYDGGTVARSPGGLSLSLSSATMAVSASSLVCKARLSPKPTMPGDAATVVVGGSTSPRYFD